MGRGEIAGTLAPHSPPTRDPTNRRPLRRRGSKSGYVPTEWSASLVRPHLDEIPERSLPDSVEVRPVTPDQLRTILAADFEAFRGEWDFHEPTEEDYADVLESPYLDESLWKVAWAGDVVVGQVKTFINPDENRRGATGGRSTPSTSPPTTTGATGASPARSWR